MSEQGIRLRPLFRKSDDHSANHFVRLSPCTALRLRDAATMAERNILSYDVARKVQPDLSSTPVRRNWSIGDTLVPSTLCALGIEFLPLEISTNDAETVYASYNGGDLDLREHSLVPEGEGEGFFISKVGFVLCCVKARDCVRYLCCSCDEHYSVAVCVERYGQ